MAELFLPSRTLGRSDGALLMSNSFWILIDATILCRCMPKAGLGWSFAKTGGEAGSFATSSSLRFFS
jgi:hypothetical protein